MNATLLALIAKTLQQHHAGSLSDIQVSPVGGGSINDTYRLTLGSKTFFCKVNSAVKFPHLFDKEKQGLDLIARQTVIRTPEVIDSFEAEEHQVLLLEWIKSGDKNKEYWRKFGRQLAAMHAVSGPHFGYASHNYMGSVEQLNTPSPDWIHFFTSQRLQRMLDLCLSQHLLAARHQKLFDKLYDVLPQLFDNQQKPALLHGDLWSGNYMCSENGDPVLIDPAVYFGHPAVDLGMTTLFGGFPPDFYEAYAYHLPLPPEYNKQWQVANLYPLLIHLLLFGRSYLPQIESTLQQFA